jgi:hypothetical protein
LRVGGDDLQDKARESGIGNAEKRSGVSLRGEVGQGRAISDFRFPISDFRFPKAAKRDFQALGSAGRLASHVHRPTRFQIKSNQTWGSCAHGLSEPVAGSYGQPRVATGSYMPPIPQEKARFRIPGKRAPVASLPHKLELELKLSRDLFSAFPTCDFPGLVLQFLTSMSTRPNPQWPLSIIVATTFRGRSPAMEGKMGNESFRMIRRRGWRWRSGYWNLESSPACWFQRSRARGERLLQRLRKVPGGGT